VPPPARRAIPDNLDPLVDTLSNVVGILVIVVALTQIQLGDALTRVIELDLRRSETERAGGSTPRDYPVLQARRDALLLRTEVDIDESIAMARRTLDSLEAGPIASSTVQGASIEELEARVTASKAAVDERRSARDRRVQYAERLAQVPKKMVARLPDPMVMQGKESWIIVRYGRIFLADRANLFEEAERAIVRILGTVVERGRPRAIRPDEYAAISLYLRKRDVGAGNFNWHLRTDAPVRVELVWRSKDPGLHAADLAGNVELDRWLAERSPSIDAIRFHVWADSFEAYLAAREAVEAAGFRAGWTGYEEDRELALPLRIGPANPDIGPVVVD
jgi:hypothetical protein